MISVTGEPYSSLANAFKYRTSIDSFCTCRPAGGYAAAGYAAGGYSVAAAQSLPPVTFQDDPTAPLRDRGLRPAKTRRRLPTAPATMRAACTGRCGRGGGRADRHRRRWKADPHRRAGLLGKQQGAGRPGDRARSELTWRDGVLAVPSPRRK